MAASFCWMKLKDASVQTGGEVVNVVESVRDAQQVDSYRASDVDCSCAVAARSQDARPEASGNCLCCSSSMLPYQGWGARFNDNVATGFSATTLTAPDAVVWRIEGPSFKGADGEPDSTLTCSPPFATREEAVVWLRGTYGQDWSGDARSLWLLSHIH